MKRSTVLVGVLILAAIGSYLALADAVDSAELQACLHLLQPLDVAEH
jgi:hypothetical protein